MKKRFSEQQIIGFLRRLSGVAGYINRSDQIGNVDDTMRAIEKNCDYRCA